jgi:CheY-like chemotaxis protein
MTQAEAKEEIAAFRRTILLVDDDDAVRRSLQLLLHWRGYDVRSFAAAATIIADTRLDDSDVLIADYRLPDGDGFGVLRALRRNGWHGKAIMITAHASDVCRDAAAAAGFDAVLAKPLRQHELVAALGD